MSLKYKKNCVKKYLNFGISVYDQETHCCFFLEKIHVVSKFFQKCSWLYVDNRYIRGKHLYKDALHLWKKVNYFSKTFVIFYLNKDTPNKFLDYNFVEKQTDHPLVKI